MLRKWSHNFVSTRQSVAVGRDVNRSGEWVQREHKIKSEKRTGGRGQKNLWRHYSSDFEPKLRQRRWSRRREWGWHAFLWIEGVDKWRANTKGECVPGSWQFYRNHDCSLTATRRWVRMIRRNEEWHPGYCAYSLEGFFFLIHSLPFILHPKSPHLQSTAARTQVALAAHFWRVLATQAAQTKKKKKRKANLVSIRVCRPTASLHVSPLFAGCHPRERIFNPSKQTRSSQANATR